MHTPIISTSNTHARILCTYSYLNRRLLVCVPPQRHSYLAPSLAQGKLANPPRRSCCAATCKKCPPLLPPNCMSLSSLLHLLLSLSAKSVLVLLFAASCLMRDFDTVPHHCAEAIARATEPPVTMIIVYVCVYPHACVDRCIQKKVHMYDYVHLNMHSNVQMLNKMYAYTSICTFRPDGWIYRLMYVYVHVHLHTYVYTHTYIYIFTHIYI